MGHLVVSDIMDDAMSCGKAVVVESFGCSSVVSRFYTGIISSYSLACMVPGVLF